MEAFANIPYAYLPPAVRAVIRAARSETVRVAVFGDSQETWPGGNGGYFLMNLQAELAVLFGCPGSSLLCHNYLTTWAVADNAPGDAVAALATETEALLPGLTPFALSDTGDGYMQQARPRNEGLAVDVLLRNTPALDVSAGVYAEIILATAVDSGELHWQYRPTAVVTTAQVVTDAAVAAEGDSALGLDAATLSFFRFVTPLLEFDADLPIAQVRLSAAEDTSVIVVGARLLSRAQHGMLVDAYSGGGYQASTVPAGFPNCGDLLQTIGCDLALVMYGANDAHTSAVSAADFQTRLLALIAFLRQQAANLDLPVLLIPDAALTWGAGTEAAQAQYDLYAGAMYEVAQADEYVGFINVRRTTEEAGWTTAAETEAYHFTSDGVHDSLAGGRLRAQAVAAALRACLPLTRLGFASLTETQFGELDELRFAGLEESWVYGDDELLVLGVL